MNFKKSITLVLAVLSIQILRAQQDVREEVFVQLNNNDFIVGESVNFSAFTFSLGTGKLSNLSKILYIDLINESGESVYQTKVLQENGRGHGEIKLRNEFETGNYHFVAYTRWMRNFDDFFHQRIVITNPYKPLKMVEVDSNHLNVKFHTEGGQLIGGIKNRLIINIADDYNRGIMVKGKITSGSGEKLMDVASDKNGLIDIIITPSLNEIHQLILEYEGQFEFYSLPKAKNGVSMLVSSNADQLNINLAAQNIEQSGEITIFSRDQEIYTSQTSFPGKLKINKSKLPNGLLRIEVTAGQHYNRFFWNASETFLNIGNDLSYGKLESVSLPIELPDSLNYSIAISKKHFSSQGVPIELSNQTMTNIDFNQFDLSSPKFTVEALNQILIMADPRPKGIIPAYVDLLSEYRYGIIQGTVKDENHAPAKDIQLGLALRGNTDYLSATTSDSLGHFYLRYHPEDNSHLGSVCVINNNLKFYIDLVNEFYDSLPKFNNPTLYFDSTRIASIIQRSIDNQLEYIYNEDQKEVLIRSTRAVSSIVHYKLDDFTRFATMRDTFIEITSAVDVKKNEKNFDLSIKTELVNDKAIDNKAETILLLDGNFVSGEDMLSLNPAYIKSIDIINQKYFIGQVMMNGIISVHSASGDGLQVLPQGKALNITKTQLNPKSSNKTTIDKRKANRNTSIYWDPLVIHRTGSTILNFTTSNVPGLYEIKIDGIDSNGKSYSNKMEYEVQ